MPEDHVGGGTLAALEHAQSRLDELAELTGIEPVLALREGMLLSWMKARDLAPLGYLTYTALCRENCAWKPTWRCQVTGLVESGLDLVMWAVARGSCPLTVAVEAPGSCDPDEQIAWLAEVARGWRPRPAKAHRTRGPTIDIEKKHAETVHRARLRARLLMGWPAPDHTADRYVRQAWRDRIDGRKLVADAREKPPPPDPASVPPAPLGLPACGLLPDWREPTDVHDASQRLDAVQKLRRSRLVKIGRIATEMVDAKLYRTLGFKRFATLAKERLGLTERCLQEHRRLAWHIDNFEALTSAFLDGLALQRLRQLGRIVTEETEHRWVALAWHSRSSALAELVDFALQSDIEEVLAAAEAAVARMVELGGGQANDTVSLRAAQKLPPAPKYDRVHEDQVEAARWFLEQVQIPPQRGYGEVKDRQNHICQNVECRRRCLGNQAHHIHPQNEGGGHERENLECVCTADHLRGVHTGVLTTQRVKEAVLWTYPGRRVWVF